MDRRRGWKSGRVQLLMSLTAMRTMLRHQTCHTILRCAAKTRKLKESGNGWSRWELKNVRWQSWRQKRCVRATCYGLYVYLYQCRLNLPHRDISHILKYVSFLYINVFNFYIGYQLCGIKLSWCRNDVVGFTIWYDAFIEFNSIECRIWKQKRLQW